MILDEIIDFKKNEVALLKEKKYSLLNKLKEEKLTLIAEIKKASPSKGIISENFNPARQLTKYQQAGAGAVSILTDRKFFQGSSDILKKLRPQANLPLLRKDFIVDVLQIYESCLLGADVILLIAAVLSPQQIEQFLQLARKLGMEAIVEVHSLSELEEVLATSAEIIGVNNRNLKDFTVDLTTTEKIVNRLIQLKLFDKYLIIAESGIKNREDIRFLQGLGVNGVLIGQSLMEADDPAVKINDLLGD